MVINKRLLKIRRKNLLEIIRKVREKQDNTSTGSKLWFMCQNKILECKEKIKEIDKQLLGGANNE